MFPDLWSYSSVGIALFFGTATIIERRAYNAEAVGSNPTRTTLELLSLVLGGSFQIFFQQIPESHFKPGVAGSNPASDIVRVAQR